MQWPDGAEYIGQWKQGRRNGKGTFTTPNGNQYIGNWKGGKMNGQVTYLEADGTKYHGKWVNGNLKGIEPDGSDTAQSDAIIEEKSNLEQQVPLPNSAPTSSIEVHTKDDKHELPSVNNNNIQKEETHVEAETIVAFKSGVVKNGKGSYV